jgi:hypothetical protein
MVDPNGLSHAEFLELILADEVTRRDATSAEGRPRTPGPPFKDEPGHLPGRAAQPAAEPPDRWSHHAGERPHDLTALSPGSNHQLQATPNQTGPVPTYWRNAGPMRWRATSRGTRDNAGQSRGRLSISYRLNSGLAT